MILTIKLIHINYLQDGLVSNIPVKRYSLMCVVDTDMPDINLICEKANTDTTHTISDLSLDVYQVNSLYV